MYKKAPYEPHSKHWVCGVFIPAAGIQKQWVYSYIFLMYMLHPYQNGLVTIPQEVGKLPKHIDNGTNVQSM